MQLKTQATERNVLIDNKKSNVSKAARLSVAPMMDWTDRHCRYLHRLLSRNTLLYTEMVTAPALVRGGAVHLLDHSVDEYPVALQLGGSDPQELAQATKLGADAGYDEINLNVGCPSDRVQSGTFGAVLMKAPELVADCVRAMQTETDAEITVKCRIGVDDQAPEEVLPDFISRMQDAGIKRISIHARKAWLKGLSPKENRDVPPLDYPLVYQMKRDFPALHLSINGGVSTLEEALAHLAHGMDGVMIGRAAYHNPTDILSTADREIYGMGADTDPIHVVHQMLPYIETHLTQGGKLNQITRHMLGLFAGKPGARAWRRYLSEHATTRGAGPDTVLAALQNVTQAAV
ncbi:tRNA dihydrouridine(20/20a) synthase DusA [Shimia sagamensis]|uniref:tRNA-dihydrouridine(20/20a) synthase n=1 Tax=Shimia sagamensis TaxID=1566352 RepID=A0ABY1PIS2_9RHOB|nr:tRNA dihydrouridine(20/20a) synthase DusA [Shimia sagamensis]SMP35295.1 tRNA-U16,U17-dihydrouridine synthase [Shimia sagamensis]